MSDSKISAVPFDFASEEEDYESDGSVDLEDFGVKCGSLSDYESESDCESEIDYDLEEDDLEADSLSRKRSRGDEYEEQLDLKKMRLLLFDEGEDEVQDLEFVQNVSSERIEKLIMENRATVDDLKAGIRSIDIDIVKLQMENDKGVRNMDKILKLLNQRAKFCFRLQQISDGTFSDY